MSEGSIKKPRANQHNSLATVQDTAQLEKRRKMDERTSKQKREEVVDSMYGYDQYHLGEARTGFVFNLRDSVRFDDALNVDKSMVECFCVEEDGSTFKVLCDFSPYMLVRLLPGSSYTETEDFFYRQYPGMISVMEHVWKEDLDLPNHQIGQKQDYVKISFHNANDQLAVRRFVLQCINYNKKREESNAAYTSHKRTHERVSDTFIDIREYDVVYSQRMMIDTDQRCGLWFDFQPQIGSFACTFKPRPDLVERPLMKVFAYDIETTKSPLKFPNSAFDQIMMISIMVDARGLLLVNRDIVSEDIDDFEYTPKPEYPGVFQVINCANEKETLRVFYEFILEEKPLIYVTYNGDFFDWPFVHARSRTHGMDLTDLTGIYLDEVNEEYKGRFSVHLDAFCWVKRDSYLPQGSHGLKAVTKAKLKYNPVEVDPEDMQLFAKERPNTLATYSVSDAVATYYLYMKYVHLFIFSLCVIIPFPPSDILRKGSGTLCESLLMVQAYQNNVVAPNKQMEQHIKYYQGHVLESETYVGGHVECLESGIFRTDIPVQFKLNSERIQQLLDTVDDVLKYCIEVENFTKLTDIVNLAEVRQDIITKLEYLRDNPDNMLPPLIYHLDVGAMYPNIILTNRLQPYAIVDPSDCAACDYNTPGALCQRKLTWAWRGKWFLPHKGEVSSIRKNLEYNYKPLGPKDPKTFSNLPNEEQGKRLKAALKKFSSTLYKKITKEQTIEQEATTCQREHSFYVDTVRAFRDRRYDYKRLNKEWNGHLKSAKDALAMAKAKDMILLYDSMQLAHKCILNSFYGYVMRKGARWCSMPMAGVVTKTGSSLIQRALELVQAVGKTLELDTDGIWCVLPDCFPENYSLKTAKGGKISMSYPCSILNLGVSENFTNDQYHELVDKEKREYEIRKECSIFFEVDGPYRCMILPASQHEGKNIKKRYAVFNQDGSLAELKGFEIKRRGELKLVKQQQNDLFYNGTFLKGHDLQSCYDQVGAVCQGWLNVLKSKGADLEDEDVFDYISENKSMSDALANYGDNKSTSITTAKRLGEFLGMEMVQDKGLNCKFIIAKKPDNLSVSERAIPVAIFNTEPAVKKHYLRKWQKDSTLEDFDIRNIVDWDYYATRLGSAIQKIVTIPAAHQKIDNPVPDIPHPEWLAKFLLSKNSKVTQKSIKEFFNLTIDKPSINDIEDVGESTEAVFSQKKAAIARKVHATNEHNHSGSIDDLEDDQFGMLDVKPAAPNMPDINKDISSWIRAKKKQWNVQKQEGDALSHAPATAQNIWQVVSYHSKSPGFYDLWVLENNQLRSYEVQIPRVFYLNCLNKSIGAGLGKLVEKTLPRGRKAHHLYEITATEKEYQENHQLLIDLERNPEVEGVLETDISPVFSAILKYGAFMIPTAEVRAQSPFKKDFKLSELDALPPVAEYLYPVYNVFQIDSKINLVYVVLFSQEKRAVAILSSTCGLRTYILTVGTTTHLDTYVRDQQKDLHNPNTVYEHITYASVDDQLASIPKLLLTLRSPQPNIVVVKTNQVITLPNIVHSDFPVLMLAQTKFEMPPIQWETTTLKTVLFELQNIPNTFTSLLDISIQCNVPLCEIPTDAYVGAQDVVFARTLRDSNHVLWNTHLTTPDTSAKDLLKVAPNVYAQPGCYRTVCIGLNIKHLVLNALLNYKYLDNDDHLFGQDISGISTGTNAAAGAFKVLQTMIHNLMIAYERNASACVENMANNVLRWIQVRNSTLYDPMLQFLVQRAIQKSFLQLLMKFKELNCQVISASDNVIVINTGKITVDKAHAYVDYIIETISSDPLFTTLTLTPVSNWHYMLSLDANNYIALASAETSGEQEEEETLHYVSNWSLIEAQPPIVKRYFEDVLSTYIQALYTYQQQLEQKDTTTSMLEQAAEYAKVFVSKTFQRLLLDVVAALQSTPITVTLEEEEEEEQGNPDLILPLTPQQQAKVGNPDTVSLMFVKLLTFVLMKDDAVLTEVSVVRENQLLKLGVRAFSEDAVYTPSTTTANIDIACLSCLMHTTVDLTRTTETIGNQTWHCTSCATSLHASTVEAQFLVLIKDLVEEYQVQDQICMKCHGVKPDNMNPHCSCSGKYKTTKNKKDILLTLQSYKHVAEYHKFLFAQDTLAWVLQYGLK